MRPIWTGTISFGLVSIPVRLVPAEAREELDFTLLDTRDSSPIGYQKINKRTGQPVPADRIARGFEYAQGRYVIVSEDDLRRASPERTRRIDIHSFADLDEIDPRYFDRPYYLEPAPGGEKAYALLREALERTGKVGIATVVVKTREHLAAVVPRAGILVLNLLRHASELRDPVRARTPSGARNGARVSDREVKMAERLIQEMAAPWKPEQYRDDYRNDLMAFIKKRAKRGALESAPEEATPPARRGEVVDIATLLRKSLEGTRDARPRARARVSARARAARPRARSA